MQLDNSTFGHIFEVIFKNINRLFFRAVLDLQKNQVDNTGNSHLAPPPPIFPIINILHKYGAFVTIIEPILVEFSCNFDMVGRRGKQYLPALSSSPETSPTDSF